MILQIQYTVKIEYRSAPVQTFWFTDRKNAEEFAEYMSENIGESPHIKSVTIWESSSLSS